MSCSDFNRQVAASAMIAFCKKIIRYKTSDYLFFLPFFRGYTVLKGDIPPIPTVGAINIHTIRDNSA